ncbi:MAG TPA: hypothetical protein VHL11_07730, partial [Phototrophicaceae bacterium]|nr:hypothetical protein [Phototrophicaceae bacterium]
QQVGFVTLTPTLVPTVTTTIDPENTPEPTAFPTKAPELTADVLLLLDVRHDMGVLADDRFGPGARPIGWNFGITNYDPQIALLTRGDLELLATAVINPTARPEDWIGAFSSTPYAVARDERYDLELLANLVYGKDHRPEGWIGGDPLLRCNRSTQTLVALLERGGVYHLTIPPNTPNFCHDTELDVTKFVETQILANAQVGSLFNDQVTLLAKNEITSEIAVAFLDSAATRRVGVIPNGTPIQVIGRSYVQFSKMMLVSGADFQVFVDYTNTTVDDQQFRGLPNVESLEIAPACFADWCGSK